MSKTAIIGLGVTGYSCLRYLHDQCELVVVDTRPAPPYGERAQRSFTDIDYRFGIDSFDFRDVSRAIVSPGVPLDSCLLAPARRRGVELVSDLDLFFSAVTAPVIGVTGTNGKSTVTSLVGHILNESGQRAAVGGNLGEAALDLLAEEADLYVLELSSFQLERMASHALAAATILNISADHLDRHGDIDAYAQAKQLIYRVTGLAVANRSDSRTMPSHTVDALTTFGQDRAQAGHWGLLEIDGERWLARGGEPIVAAAELSLAGRHNEQNVLAAFALLTNRGLGDVQLRQGARSFVGLPHRCQLVAERRGIRYVNDSKATNVGATLSALTGLGNPETPNLVLIAGGDGKGADFGELRDYVGRFVRTLVLIGADAPRIESAVTGPDGAKILPVRRAGSMAQAVRVATEIADSGDTVLLSPACASFDMFKDFNQRGDVFCELVEALPR